MVVSWPTLEIKNTNRHIPFIFLNLPSVKVVSLSKSDQR